MNELLGIDLDLGLRVDEEGVVRAGPSTLLDLQAAERQGVWPAARDLTTASGRANLAQALVLRLLTRRGELALLGHPEYGSRHHELIGEPNTDTKRNLLKLHVLECLSQEPRVRVERLDVRPVEGRENRDKVRVEARLAIHGDPQPLNLVVPFSFSGVGP
jgi:phage baseplate assembly protein W